jgi:outer membrane lipoprotein SlyB
VSGGRVGAAVAGAMTAALAIRANLGPLAADRAGRHMTDALEQVAQEVELDLRADDGALTIVARPGRPLAEPLSRCFGEDRVTPNGEVTTVILQRPGLTLAR